MRSDAFEEQLNGFLRIYRKALLFNGSTFGHLKITACAWYYSKVSNFIKNFIYSLNSSLLKRFRIMITIPLSQNILHNYIIPWICSITDKNAITSFGPRMAVVNWKLICFIRWWIGRHIHTLGNSFGIWIIQLNCHLSGIETGHTKLVNCAEFVQSNRID